VGRLGFIDRIEDGQSGGRLVSAIGGRKENTPSSVGTACPCRKGETPLRGRNWTEDGTRRIPRKRGTVGQRHGSECTTDGQRVGKRVRERNGTPVWAGSFVTSRARYSFVALADRVPGGEGLL